MLGLTSKDDDVTIADIGFIMQAGMVVMCWESFFIRRFRKEEILLLDPICTIMGG